MKSAYSKDILRCAKKGWKRFLSILIITALGVAMLTGLYAACLDMYRSADRFYDKQKLFDIRILSTLGLTGEDVAALSRVSEVETAEGAYSETVYTEADGARKSAEMTVLGFKGLNLPYLVTGALPSKSGEIAVTQKYLDESGKAVGDTLTIEEDTGEGKNEASEAKTQKDGTGADADIDIEAELEEAETPTFRNTTYTISGVVIDPLDIQSSGYASTFRSATSADYTFFIIAEDAEIEVFTSVYIVLSGAKDMTAFSDEYERAVAEASRYIEEHIKAQREKERYDTVVLEAREKISDAESTMNEEFAKADSKLSDAWEDIEKAKREFRDGEAELAAQQRDVKSKLAQARAELESAKRELEEAEAELSRGETELNEAGAELNKNAQGLIEGRKRFEEERLSAETQLAAAEKKLLEAQAQLDTARTQLEPSIAQMKASFGGAWPESEWNGLVNAAAAFAAAGADDEAIASGTASQIAALSQALPAQAEAAVQLALGLGKINGGQQALDIQKSAFAAEKEAATQRLAEAQAELDQGEARIEEARRTIEEKKAELEAGKAELREGKAKLSSDEEALNAQEADALKKLADAWQKLNEGKDELREGEAELFDNELKYAEKKEEAQRKLKEAYAELDDIDMTRWYVQDRGSLNSYSSLESDLSSIEAVGRVFPVIFLFVAVLMSLTTMTRMVEEERGLIGVYKALGFKNGAIYWRYLLFAFTACLLGGAFGDVLGFVLIPKFVALVMEELYSLPGFHLSFDYIYGVGGVLLFMAGIVGGAALACRSELSQMPANLMRPKAPRSGARVFLERIPAIWNRLGFLRKVTVRNLFRYKKRLFMTIGGIMGCTALILCGFAIKDSIADLAPKQYDDIYLYDLMALSGEKENDALIEKLSLDEDIEDYFSLRIESIKLINADGGTEKVQLMVIPEGASISDYIRTENLDGALVYPDKNGILVTQNAAQMLDLTEGGTVFLQDLELFQHEAAVSGIVKNYLGNNVYMTQDMYEALFGEYVPNGVLAHLSEACQDHAAYAEALAGNDFVLSSVSTAELREDFGFDLINSVVVLITSMAGGLAFVVLFTLSSTNISERVRELATIKVLGFYDGEVHQYVNRETLILSLIGILLGLPVGRVISGFLTVALKMPSIHFAVKVELSSYLISAAVTLCFTVIVNWMTNRTLDRINMVEALKSVE